MSKFEKEKSSKELFSDAEVIKRIKEIQELPEEIIIKFIQAAAVLSTTDFNKHNPNE